MEPFVGSRFVVHAIDLCLILHFGVNSDRFLVLTNYDHAAQRVPRRRKPNHMRHNEEDVDPHNPENADTRCVITSENCTSNGAAWLMNRPPRTTEGTLRPEQRVCWRWSALYFVLKRDAAICGALILQRERRRSSKHPERVKTDRSAGSRAPAPPSLPMNSPARYKCHQHE